MSSLLRGMATALKLVFCLVVIIRVVSDLRPFQNGINREFFHRKQRACSFKGSFTD